MKIFDLVPSWVYALVIVTLTGLWGVAELRVASAKLDLANYQAEIEAETRKAEQRAREAEQAMQASADQLRQEKDREIREVTARAAALSNSLRNRPERPQTGSVPSTADTCAGASGAQLARGDGEFLAGYAADAARLAVALDQCVKQYESVRKTSK